MGKLLESAEESRHPSCSEKWPSTDRQTQNQTQQHVGPYGRLYSPPMSCLLSSPSSWLVSSPSKGFFFQFFFISDGRTLPLFLSAISITYVLFRACLFLHPWARARAGGSYSLLGVEDNEDNDDGIPATSEPSPSTSGYRASIHLTRLFACLALFTLTIYALFTNEDVANKGDGGDVIEKLFLAFYVRPQCILNSFPRRY